MAPLNFLTVLQDKLRHIKILRIYLSKNQFEWGHAKPEVVKKRSSEGSKGETFIEKRRKQSKEDINWLYLKTYLAICDWLSVLKS